MDCAVEEFEIRRALEGIAGLRSLVFRLGARTLSIDAPGDALEQTLAAIRRAGFDPQPLTEAAAPVRGAQGPSRAATTQGWFSEGPRRLGLALAFAIAA